MLALRPAQGDEQVGVRNRAGSGDPVAAGELSALSVAHVRLERGAQIDVEGRVEGAVILVGVCAIAGAVAAFGALFDAGNGLVLVALGALAVVTIARLVGDRPRRPVS